MQIVILANSFKQGAEKLQKIYDTEISLGLPFTLVNDKNKRITKTNIIMKVYQDIEKTKLLRMYKVLKINEYETNTCGVRADLMYIPSNIKYTDEIMDNYIHILTNSGSSELPWYNRFACYDNDDLEDIPNAYFLFDEMKYRK